MTTNITDERRLALLKHLAGGKDLDAVATILGTSRSEVLDIASHHGYPDLDKVQKAVTLVAAKIDRTRTDIPAGRPAPVERAPRPASTSPSSITSPDARPIGHAPDEIRVLINAAKAHPAKRIQAQADRVLDALGRLRDLFAEDEAKHAERRAQDAKKAAARAEIQRLEKQLADARAKLRGTPATGTGTPTDGSVSSADVRAWAKDRGLDCPAVGRVPTAIRDQYDAEHQQQDGAA